jgi:hypothetical protein
MIGMGLIILTWLLLAAVFTGLGLIAYRAFGLRLKSAETLFLSFWAGWALSLVVVQLWAFVFPVNDALRGLLVLAGLTGLVWRRGELWQLVRAISRWGWVLLAFAGFFTIWLANISLSPISFNITDAGLYHMAYVDWASAYPYVPGLANLHFRLGFSNGFFLHAALYNIGPWTERVHHIASGLLFWVFTIALMFSALSLFRNREPRAVHIFYTLSIPITFFYHLGRWSTPVISNDPPLFVLGIVTAGQVLYLITAPALARREALFRLWLVVLLATAGVTVKFSFVVLGATLSVLALLAWTLRCARGPVGTGWNGSLIMRGLALVSVSAVLVLVPMAGRSLILTGYPAFPSTLGAAPVDWRVPEEVARLESDFIRSWARQTNEHPEVVLANWDWLEPWWNLMRQQHPFISIPLTLTVLSLAALGIARKLPEKYFTTKRVGGLYWLFLLSPVLAGIFWFWAAPGLRFLGAIPWVLAAGAVTQALQHIQIKHRYGRPVYIVVVVVVVLMTSVVYFIHKAGRSYWVRPDSSNYGLHSLPVREVQTVVETDTGLLVVKPTTVCWNGPLLCTPYPNPEMRLRVEGELRHGFTLQPQEPLQEHAATGDG